MQNIRSTRWPGIQMFDLSTRVALITGGSKGLGEVIAAGLASAGADVALLSRNLAEAQIAAERLHAEYHVRTFGVEADVSDEGQIVAAVDQVVSRLGKVDILVNSAGINIRGPICELTYDQFQRVQKTNVDGSWLFARAVLPSMRAQRWGRIINMSSALGLVGLAERTPYATSKGAIVQLTRTLAMELAPEGINVNAICPGPFLTEMNEGIKDNEQTKKDLIGAVALKRWASLEEIQGAAIYLASPASSFVTGSLLAVDGGWTAH